MFYQILLYGKAIKKQIPMFEDLSSESSKLLYVLISSLLSFRRVNIRHLELNILVCNVLLTFREQGLRVCIFTIRERASIAQSLCKFYSCEYSLSGATWLTVIIFSKTVCKYSHFLLLELKNIVSILECVLPKLNIEESCLLAILLDQNSKHAGQASTKTP